MKKTQFILICESFAASEILLLRACLLLLMIALAATFDTFRDVDTLFKRTCVLLKYAFPLGLVFAIPSVMLAVVKR